MRVISLVVFLATTSAAFAQQDTTRQNNSEDYQKKLNKVDSSSNKVNTKIDAVQGKVNSILNPDLSSNAFARKAKTNSKSKKDSLQFYKQVEKEKKRVKTKIDNLNAAGQPTEKYQHQFDSLEVSKYDKNDDSWKKEKPKKKVEAVKQKLASKGDSLNGLNRADKYKSKLDSVTGIPTNQVSKAQSKADDVEQKLNAPVNKVEGTLNEKLNLMNQEGGAGANIPGNVNLSDANIKTDLNLTQPDLELDNPIGKVENPLQDQMGGVGEVKDKINDVKGLPGEQINKVKSIDEVIGVQDKLGAANSVTDKAQAYSGDVKNITQGNLNEVKEAPKALEAQAGKMDEVAGIKKEAGAFDQYKDMATKGNDPEAMKQLAMEQAKESFKPPVNHFAGHEEVLQKAMDNMSKLKTKYNSLDSLKDIPKRKLNEMKGKPFIERIVPGIMLQIQKAGDVLVDYNPYVGYRFYGKFTAGIGWNERFNIGKHFHFSLNDRIYGPRVFADFKIKSGFSVRTDIEKMNTEVPSIGSGPNTDPTHRSWVWSAFIGIRKEYKFWGSVKGNAQFLYNLYDDHNNSPYSDRFAVRMGFEFPMKKKVN